MAEQFTLPCVAFRDPHNWDVDYSSRLNFWHFPYCCTESPAGPITCPAPPSLFSGPPGLNVFTIVPQQTFTHP